MPASSKFDDASMATTRCDHDFEPISSFVEHGHHATMGKYERQQVRCTRCEVETTMTVWIDLSEVASRSLR